MTEKLDAFLPPHLIDVHTHVYRAADQPKSQGSGRERLVTWPARVATENPVKDLIETYRLLFPGRRVTPMMFGMVLSHNSNAARDAAYVASCARAHGFPALIFAMPTWTATDFEQRIIKGGFLGVKCYLSLAPPYIPTSEIRIFDFLPHYQLEVLNRHGWIAMLHIPRDARLKDPVNLAQMLEIESRYPNLKLIIAHVGRAYCPEDVGAAFKVLKATKRMFFDFSANTNAGVFRQLIETVGPKRILFGSDLPITRMRMRRICEKGNYVNLVPRGLYGDVSGDSHMRAVGKTEAARMTFFLYEEIAAFRRAAADTGLTPRDIRLVFHDNAAAMIRSASGNG